MLEVTHSPERTNTSRQLINLTGGITLTARYTPCPLRCTLGVLRKGDTLELHGTGSLRVASLMATLRDGFATQGRLRWRYGCRDRTALRGQRTVL